MPAGTYNAIAGRSLTRLAAISDGLFAVAMTLLFLDIRIPDSAAIHTDAQLAAALVALAPKFVTYLLSFMTLAIFWLGQQAQLENLREADRDLTWLHLAYLAIVAFVPFSTAVLSAHVTLRLALLLYWGNILALGVGLYVTWTYAAHFGLVKEDAPADLDKAVRSRIVVAQAFYGFGALLCLINTYWSIGFIVLVQLYYAVAPRWRTAARTPVPAAKADA